MYKLSDCTIFPLPRGFKYTAIKEHCRLNYYSIMDASISDEVSKSLMSDYHDENFTDDITVRSRASINMTLHSKNFYLHEFRHNDCNPIAIDIYNIMSDNLKTIFNIKYLADKRLIKENS